MNSKQLIKFVNFYDEISKLCEKTPIVYGSLAIFLHTKSSKFKINDIDALIHEKEFAKLIQKLKKNKIKYKYDKKWHVLQVFKGKLKIEFDSIEYWHKPAKTTVQFKVQNVKLKAVTLKTLTNIYERAARASKDNPEGNLKKYLFLISDKFK